MTAFDSEYFFIRKPGTGNFPFLVPDSHTAERRFRFEAQAAGSASLVFHNGWQQKFSAQGIQSPTPAILFAGADLVVHAPIRDQLLALSIPDLHLHPAVYVDDEGRRHADRWYLTFTARFDCWDREASDVEEDLPPMRSGGAALYQVYAYRLDDALLAQTPRERRLLFTMGGDQNGFVVCHQSIAGIFRADGQSGAHLQAVADY